MYIEKEELISIIQIETKAQNLLHKPNKLYNTAIDLG